MTDFSQAYRALNDAQREAVDTIDGPVLVVAGPGTGKTQLLSMRAANIVRSTDTLPNNILCMTFTESAAAAMRQRLISLMGPEGNKITIHTFHSFGADIINSHPEHFYNGAKFTPADELTGYEIMREIFESLPHSSPLAKTMNGEYTSLRDAKSAISHLKRAGLLPEELLAVLDHNQTFCEVIEPVLGEVFADRFSKKDLPKFQPVAEQMAAFTPAPLPLSYIKPLHELCAHEFATALADAAETGKTTTVTAWRNRWLEKNHLGQFVFKDRKKTKKLRALAEIYKKYREALLEQALFDFDDMVSLVAHTLETTPELRLNLQEQFLYIMVDEFQDTNGAQARLLTALTNNPVYEGRPNILAVGDDDQAIYAFQGAELSNILEFAARYTDTKVITLTDNYRSTAEILKHARRVITQGTNRLETSLENVRKDLTAHSTAAPTGTELHIARTPDAELHWTAQEIKKRVAAGTPPGEIAVLARHHKQLLALLPHLHAADIAVNYERRNNVLESAHIIELITLSEVVVALGEQRYDVAESLLPELLSYNFWGIKTEDLWKLSISAYKQRRMWLELMIESQGRLRQIAEFIIVASHQAMHEPLETMLDILLGTNEVQAPTEATEADTLLERPEELLEEFVSPYRAFYFNKEKLDKNPAEYLTLLSNLRAIRRAVAAYRPNTQLNLRSFIDFIDLCERTNTAVVDTTAAHEGQQGVVLMTAHKAKGLEFNTVFVLSCQDEVWGRKARRPSGSLGFPYNLPIEPAGSHYDDALRLFFVAMTRAKQHLVLTAHQADPSGKEAIMAEFLQDGSLNPIIGEIEAPRIEELTPGWELRHLTLPSTTREELLQPVINNYQLSATHLNNFLDVTRGGPQAFLLQNMLRFPQAMTPSQAFGHAIHAVLARAHTHLSATGERRPIEDILHDYELQLQNARLGERDFAYLLEKGSAVLHTFLAQRYESFVPEQKAERGFGTQNVRIGDVHLTGAIDLLDVNKELKTLIVTDYKTGKSHSDWRAITDYERIKMHKYKQQLMLYKFLAENSRDFAGYTVQKGVLEFVEHDENKQCHSLELTFDPDDLQRLRQLATAVWDHIMRLDFPDTTKYEPTFNGILAFERDLLDGTI
ncbi:MAG TPA: ATP-dependent DNA helicase [Candidatus Saccharimonadales bacterium]|nr:ATP-dependent DNA helicase [Candidatus Saccharimonadales bacterium]